MQISDSFWPAITKPVVDGNCFLKLLVRIVFVCFRYQLLSIWNSVFRCRSSSGRYVYTSVNIPCRILVHAYFPCPVDFKSNPSGCPSQDELHIPAQWSLRPLAYRVSLKGCSVPEDSDALHVSPLMNTFFNHTLPRHLGQRLHPGLTSWP